MIRCPRCGGFIRAGGSASLTQWISACKCAGTNQTAASADENDSRTVIPNNERYAKCQKCGLQILQRKSGTLSQWVFSSHHCRCETPLPLMLSPEELESTPTDLSPPNEPEIEVDPTTFPKERFKPLAHLGSGSAGRIYLARDRILGKKVAIKCLRAFTSDQLVNFQREAKATSQLKHQNILNVLDFGIINGTSPYMVLDYVKGESLEKTVSRQGALPVPEAISVCRQIAGALAHAHTKGIFHRDIKSSNVLIRYETTGQGREVRAFLIDFGLATTKATEQEKTEFQGRTMVGTPAYMPPDQALGLAYDQRSDIYALGCVLFEALTGSPPFQGETASETISLHAHCPPPSLKERSDTNGLGESKYPEELQDIVARCLEKDRDERFQTAEELIYALDELPLDIVLDSSSCAGESRSVQRNVLHTGVAIIAAPVVALIAVFLYFSPQLIEKKKPAPAAKLAFVFDRPIGHERDFGEKKSLPRGFSWQETNSRAVSGAA